MLSWTTKVVSCCASRNHGISGFHVWLDVVAVWCANLDLGPRGRLALLHRRGSHEKPQCGVWPQHWLCENLHRQWRNDAEEATGVRVWLWLSTTYRRPASSAWKVPQQSHPPEGLFCPSSAWQMLHGQKWTLLLLVFTKRPLQQCQHLQKHATSDFVITATIGRHFHEETVTEDIFLMKKTAPETLVFII